MAAETKKRKLKPEDWSVSEVPSEVNLGFDLSGRTTLGWDVAASKNLLIAGYGVRQAEWAINSIVRHFKHHGIDAYGLDFGSFLTSAHKPYFKGFDLTTGGAEQMLTQLADSSREHLLLITGLDRLLAPTYVFETARAAEPQRRARALELLSRELDNPASRVVVVTSRLNEEQSLPSAWRQKFPTYMISSKIFARDRQHLLREDQDSSAIEAGVGSMAATNSLLLPAGGSVTELISFRTRPTK